MPLHATGGGDGLERFSHSWFGGEGGGVRICLHLQINFFLHTHSIKCLIPYCNTALRELLIDNGKKHTEDISNCFVQVCLIEK